MERMTIYLDYNATTPVDPEVARAMLPYLYGHYGNPSSPHALGRAARGAVEKARVQVAGLLGCRPAEIVFTSGGSEASNTVIKGIAATRGSRGGTIVVSAVEHPAVMEPCRALEREGFRVVVVPVDGEGRVDANEVGRALTSETILVSIMHANNEVGTIQPIEEIAALAHERGIPVHTDAAQSVGKIPVDVEALRVDFLSLAGHKLYAPKGVGALYAREGRPLPSLIHGAGHEGGRRAGTENVLEIVGLGRACELAAERLGEGARHCREMRDRLWERLSASGADLRRNGSVARGLPNTLSVSIRGVDAAALLAEIGDQVAASAGAACHGAEATISSVLKAMEVPAEYASGTVRFSVGGPTTGEEIDRAADIVIGAIRKLGSRAPRGERLDRSSTTGP